MSYSGGRLAPWFDAAPNVVFCIKAANAGGSRLTELVKMNTPIDTGELRASITKIPLTIGKDELGRTEYSSGAQTEVEYAPYVEWDTKPHLILPKKPGGVLHWVNAAGEDVFAAKVNHPGTTGQHMFAIAVAIAEHELDSITAPALNEWARSVELQNHSGLAGL